ncbi:MAG: hypothetical protein AABY64_10230 [Bdellovibrionota bacterium]
MGSFSKTKILTLVMFFMTGMSGVGFSQPAPAQFYPPTCPSAEQQLEIKNLCNGRFSPTEKSNDKDRRDCISEETAALNCPNSNNNKDVQCTSLRDKMTASLAKCPPTTCQEVVDLCTGDTGMTDDSNSMVNALITQTTGFNLNPSNNGITNCDINYSDHRAERREARTDREAVQKEIATAKKKAIEDLTEYQKAVREIAKAQTALKKELNDLIKENKAKSREKFKELSDTQLKLNDQVRQSYLVIGNLRSQLSKMTNNKKKMLANYDLNSISRACRGQILKGRAEECKKDPGACQKIVNNALGSAFTSGGTRTADRNADFDSCVKNTVLEYSQKIDEASDDLKNMQAQINSKNEELATVQEAQKKNEDFLMQELEQMRVDQTADGQRIAQEYQELENQRREEQTTYGTKQMENLRLQTELNGRLAMTSSAANTVGTRPRRIGKDLSGSDAIGEISSQAEYRRDAERYNCCKGNTSSELCKDTSTKKNKTTTGGK